MSGRIITFDGVDCSFKETNSHAYLKYLLNKGEKAALYSFPRYDMAQSIFVKRYLSGAYGKIEDINLKAISMFYMMDMFDCAQTEIIPKLNEGYTIILDRYWHCNLFYRIGACRMNGDSHIVEKVITADTEELARILKLPKADIIIKLKPETSIMLNFVRNKNSKDDQHESNAKYLSAVAEVFSDIDLSSYVKDRVLEIHTTKDGNIRPKEDIFNDILRGINHD
jgi:dTMP kinase